MAAAVNHQGDDKNGVSAADLKSAMYLPWLAQAISHLVVRYDNEGGGNMSPWEKFSSLIGDQERFWQVELKRIKKLKWWDQVQAIKGFPQEHTVWHFHPMGIIGNFKGECNCNCINVDAFLQAYEEQHTLFESGTKPLNTISKENLRIFIQKILGYYEKYKNKECNIPYIAYMLATARLETKKYHRDIKEFVFFESTVEDGENSYFNQYDPVLADTKKQGERAKNYGNTNEGDGYTYRGRGYVQVTWKNNYDAIGQKIGIDLVAEPDRMLDPEIAAWATVSGMENGIFTGKKLSDYIDSNKQDYVNARKIINGLNQAEKIASFAIRFKAILESVKC